jgi:hypothetical protein
MQMACISESHITSVISVWSVALGDGLGSGLIGLGAGLGFSVTKGVSGGLGAGISIGGRVQPANRSTAIRITNSNLLLIIRQKTLYVNW